MPQSSRTTDEWITLAQQGKEVWNEQVALLQPNDFIDFRKAEITNHIDFSGFHFPVTTDFAAATFQSKATFANAEFHDIADFNNATFNGDASFVKTTFNGDTTLVVCAFFTNAEFNGGAFFDDAVFSKTAVFRNATFKQAAGFGGTQFQGAVDFRGGKFERIAKFEEAVFYVPPIFNAEDLHGYVYFNHVTKLGKQFINVKNRGAEIAYRELKLAMKRIEAHAEEDAFFRLEMLARKHREPWPRKGLYWLYEFASDYGQSIYLPVMWLGVFFLAFLWFYHLSPQFIGLGEGYDGYVNALHLALKGAFVLPGMFAGGSLEKIQLSGFGIVLAGVHWLLSAVSWFLMLLGFRNRFRLK